MNNSTQITDTIESQWARLGVLFNCVPTSSTPDLERLLLDTARQLHLNGRLLLLVSTWLVEHGLYVARHRLKRLIVEELEPEYGSALGLLLDTAVQHGAPAELRRLCKMCGSSPEPVPLSESFRSDPALIQIAKQTACELAKKWGLWSPAIELKHDAVCPSSWIRTHNPSLLPRLIRRGDLRCSILEVFRLDLDSQASTISELARLTRATRPAVYDAIKSLIGLAAGTEQGVRGILIYMAVYLFMNIGVFALILTMRRGERMVEKIDDLAGLGKTNPMMAFVLTVFMFSMAGIPPLAGFFSKFYIFLAAIEAQLYTLAIIGVLSSVVGAFYYLRLIKIVYFDEPGEALDRPVGRDLTLVLTLSGLVILLFFVYPSPVLSGASAAAAALF